MERNADLKQRGQSLVLVALMMIVFLAFLGLVLDGGFAFSKRRSAQNAADAGALAGVEMLCEPNPLDPALPEVQAETMAQFYAVQQNRADPPAQVFVNVPEREVTVTATIQVDTFFIHLVGIDQIPVKAVATAGCFTPTLGRSLIPTAWSCRPPVVGWDSDSTGCQQQRIIWDTLLDYISDDPPQVHDELYVVMDNEGLVDNCVNSSDPNCVASQDMICKQDDPVNGTLNCDLNNDGEIDWFGGGGRSWLDLDGSEPQHECNVTSSEGANELREEILGESNCAIPDDTWVPETTGDISALYGDVMDRAETNPLVLVPVYNDFCPDGDPRDAPTCNGTDPIDSEPKFLSGDDIYLTSASQPMYFRIESFAIFYITCVRRNHGDDCPGADKVIELNTLPVADANYINASSFRSIEGYFLTGYIPGLSGREDCEDGDCPDLGAYTYYLSR